MTRAITELDWQITPQVITTDLNSWLAVKLQESDFLLLGHAIDGVIWGKVISGQIYLASEVDDQVSPPLMLDTLQQLRLFNHEREIYLWWDGLAWKSQESSETRAKYPVMEQTASGTGVIYEDHILWGTEGRLKDKEFTLLKDGMQGLCHLVPIDATSVNNRNTRVRLKICHYLSEDQATGLNVIVYSRLAGLEV